MRGWLRDGLPPDAFSIDNAIIVTHTQHWPLFIDPQVPFPLTKHESPYLTLFCPLHSHLGRIVRS